MRIPQQDSAERAFNKLALTFAAQVETLKRYLGSGEQTMPRRVATALGGVWTAVQVVTGFMIFEYSMRGKWLELLKQIAASTFELL